MMRRSMIAKILFSFALLALLSVPASAQERRFEFELGANYPLIGESFEIDQNPAVFAKFQVRVSNRWWLGAVYDTLSTDGDLESLKFQYVKELPCFNPAFTPRNCDVRDSLSSGGEADITRYGLTTTVVILGEPDMQIFLTGGAGVGEIDYSKNLQPSDIPLPPDEDFDGTPDGEYTIDDIYIGGREDKTDIDLWYEAGAGIRFAFGSRWALRMQAVYRRVSPDGENTVLAVGVSEVVPSVGFTVRF